jgi:hypothetical protein
VAAEAPRRLGESVDGVASQKVTAMHHAPLDALRETPLGPDALGEIVTCLTFGLSVTRSAQLCFVQSFVAVTPQKMFVVPEEAHGQSAFEVTSLVTG